MRTIASATTAASEPSAAPPGTPAQSPLDATEATPILTIVVPTFNERDNLAELVRRVEVALTGLNWEIVFVDDDSPDGTWQLAKSLAQADLRVRCIRRIRRRGLAGACIEGMLSSAAPFVAVMDGDLQHDEAILPRMLEELRADRADLVVGSRYVDGGGAAEGFSKARASLSRSGTFFSSLVLRRSLSDPMSGFFMIRRSLFEPVAGTLASSGFKILADLLTSAPTLRVAEIGYRFRRRVAGESKLDFGVGLDFLGLVLNKLTRGVIPVRFAFFVLTGFTGLIVHLVVLRAALVLLPAMGFAPAQALAAVVAMTSNFFINNLITYRDSRLKGLKLVYGLAGFYLVCGFGLVANLGVASWVYADGYVWWAAGLVGAAMSAVWNYSLSSFFIWRKAA